MNNIITVEEFQAYAPEINLSQYTSATVSGFISQASQQIMDFIGYSPIAADIVDEVKPGMITSEGDLLIYPNIIPIVTLNSISITKGTANIALTPTDTVGNNRYNIDFTGRNIRFGNMDLQITGNFVFRNFYSLRGLQFYTKISYRGGYEPSNLPPIFKQAAALFVRDIVSLSNNPSGASRITQGEITIQYSTRDSDSDSDLVRDAKKMLRPYRRIG